MNFLNVGEFVVLEVEEILTFCEILKVIHAYSDGFWVLILIRLVV
jgi:hypothetical protein